MVNVVVGVASETGWQQCQQGREFGGYWYCWLLLGMLVVVLASCG